MLAPRFRINSHNPGRHTLGYAFIMSKKLISTQSSPTALFTSSATLLVKVKQSSVPRALLNPFCCSQRNCSLQVCSLRATTLASSLDPTLSKVIPRHVFLSLLSPFLFHRGIVMPTFHSSGQSSASCPSSANAALFHIFRTILKIRSLNSRPPYFNTSATTLSSPGAFFTFMRPTAMSNSTSLGGLSIHVAFGPSLVTFFQTFSCTSPFPSDIFSKCPFHALRSSSISAIPQVPPSFACLSVLPNSSLSASKSFPWSPFFPASVAVSPTSSHHVTSHRFNVDARSCLFCFSNAPVCFNSSSDASPLSFFCLTAHLFCIASPTCFSSSLYSCSLPLSHGLWLLLPFSPSTCIATSFDFTTTWPHSMSFGMLPNSLSICLASSSLISVASLVLPCNLAKSGVALLVVS